jgi:hypothetical protein
MAATARTGTAQARYIVRFYSPEKGGVWNRTFFDHEAAKTFAEGKRLYARPAKVETLQGSSARDERLGDTAPAYYPKPEADEQAAADVAYQAARASRVLAPGVPVRRPLTNAEAVALTKLCDREGISLTQALAREGFTP